MDKYQDYHVHCSYNAYSWRDLTIKNVIACAEKKGLKVIAITEHVRRTADWMPRYLNELRAEASMVSSNKLKVLSGFEAKILKDGSIGCCEEYSRDSFIVTSFHTIYDDKSIWIQALYTAVQNLHVDLIGHLASESTFDLNNDKLSDLAYLISSNHKIID